MRLVNATAMPAGYTTGTQPDGRELLVIVVKGTFTIPESPDQEPVLAEEQVPLVMTDEFTGEPGLSATRNEMDFAPRKPRCDVLLIGSAYAPHAKPTQRVTVSLRVGALVKSFDVLGNRVWQTRRFGTAATDPEPFTAMPISHDNAFGGVDRSQEDPGKHRWYPTNFAGVGYHEYRDAAFIDGKPLPNTEETRHPITNPSGSYKPMAFGPLGRAWHQRVTLAGTYDKKWIDNTFPFLPADFNELYYQAAPADQQIDYLQGGEEVELVNLTLEGRTKFRIPELRVPVVFRLRNGDRRETAGALDTIVLESDRKRFMLTWRSSLALRRNIHEVMDVTAGRRFEEGEVIPESGGKRWFSSLEKLAAWTREQGRPRS